MRKQNLFVLGSVALLGLWLTGVRGADPKPAGSDQKFVHKAASGGMLEVKLGQFASKHGAHPAVRQFGARMVKDHSQANHELLDLLKSKGLMAPKELDSKDQKMLDHLTALQGPAFDRTYVEHMVKDHQEDIALFEKESINGQDAQLRAFATKTLPVLREHLQLARETLQKLPQTP